MKHFFMLLGAFCAFTIFAFCSGVNLNAQSLAEQEINEEIGTWDPIDGTFLVTGDDNEETYDMPFEFYWDDELIRSVSVSTNGFVSLGWQCTSLSPFPGDSWDGYMIVAPMGDDMFTDGGIYYDVSGSAGSRVLTLQWEDVRYFGATNTDFNFQVKLYEGSNSAQIIFGPGCNVEHEDNAFCFFAGRLVGDEAPYINIVPGNPSAFYRDNTPRGISAETAPFLVEGLTYTVGAATPKLTGVLPGGDNPDEMIILQSGYVYLDEHLPGVLVKRNADWSACKFQYEISGPLPESSNPDFRVIYTATAENDINNQTIFPDESDQPVGDPGSYYFTQARGIAAHGYPSVGSTNDGALDLRTNPIVGGLYQIKAKMYLDDDDEFMEDVIGKFIIALSNDLELNRIISPKDKDNKKYPLAGGQVPVQAVVKNIGVNDVTEYSVTATIFDEDNQIVYSETFDWNDEVNPMKTGDAVQVNFPNYRTRSVGDFKLVIEATLESAIDEDLRNNRSPRTGETYEFRVSHEVEAEAIAVIRPTDADEVFAGRPIRPIGKFRNNGVSDISDVPASCVISGPLPSTDIVYSSNKIIQDIPQGIRNNTATAQFNDDFIAEESGTYQICVVVDSPDDPIDDNNLFCSTFVVSESMQGVFTIGSQNEGSPRNFPTIEDAADALFQRGITGSIVFEFTDDSYDVGSIRDNKPALDLSSKIIGVNSDNTITFRPSSSQALSSESVTINLYSGSGIGVLFGQNSDPGNNNAAVTEVSESQKRHYVNSEGHITFDGGVNKSLKFVLHSDIDFRAAFYLAEGSHNITLENLVIGNDLSDGGIATYIPLTWYNQGLSKFEYQDDIRDNGETYSAGVVFRARPPYDKYGGNAQVYDTLACNDNVVKGTKISDFGYGIVSLGTGALYRSGHNLYTKYYNARNEFLNNIITNVARAGIYLGYNENSLVKGNRIDNVTGVNSTDAAGIIAGGDAEGIMNGYNNVDLAFDGNEISNVHHNNFVSGIKIEQSRNSYVVGNGTVNFPDASENTTIKNNAVWGLRPGSADASIFGVLLQTERIGDRDPMINLITPKVDIYRTRGDVIANNTIIIDEDNFENEGPVIGAALLQTNSAVLKNNAIAFLDETIADDCPVSSLVAYLGVKPNTDGGLTSDRNAFEIVDEASACLFRFVETNFLSEILDLGYSDDFNSLNQWQMWTGQDYNSTLGSFNRDLTYLNIGDYQNLRVDMIPRAPLGSILNNRGERISDVSEDIDGNQRGIAGQPYDIGAFEFEGRMRIQDIEAISIVKPGSYKSGTGDFSGEEHIMTTAPIDVEARLRNNGNLFMSGIEARVSIYKENADGNFPADPVVETVTEAELNSGETVYVDFKLGDGAGIEFVPETYAQLGSGYIDLMPEVYAGMISNVTPRYKIVVSVQSDENNSNNTVEKLVRFFIKRSAFHLAISSEKVAFDFADDDGGKEAEVAGKLNVDNLLFGLSKLGWYSSITEGRFDLDVFDRDGWEPKAVNYDMYQTVFWTDGNDSKLNRLQILDINRYMQSARENYKKNLIIGSEEMVRLNDDQAFGDGVLRARYSEPGYPYANGETNYNGNYILGEEIGRGQELKISETGYQGETEDTPPYCGLMSVVENGEGLALPAYSYMRHETDDDNVTAGVATRTLTTNTIMIGVDWRHWDDIETMLRAIVDFVETDAAIVPVELYEFDAKAAGDRVNVSWTTTYELEADRFEVEKAVKYESGAGSFANIATEQARGGMSVKTHYGPVVDRDVNFGSTYVYRLKMYDADGEYQYGPEVEVSLDGGSFWLGDATPNPARNESSFAYSLDIESLVSIAIYDVNGKIVKTVVDEVKPAGSYVASFDVSDLSAGSYSYILRVNDQIVSKQLRVVR
jgi:hypothetical protein